MLKFVRTKDFKFLEEFGQGGTGRTILIKDEIIDESFVCKKYSPLNEENKVRYFQNFIDEIKLLHLLSHKNVVRVFNYYLYPEKTTGYILMEYVRGLKVSEYIKLNPERLSDIFVQTIEGFMHLEENKILHRDIRPENILVSNDGIVKIIDFGFGKKIDFSSDFDNSISLNWRYKPPADFQSKIYDFKTEVYFIGKLFDEIIMELDLQNFEYSNIIKEMIEESYENRISSFFEIQRMIISGNSVGIEFSDEEKLVYIVFANSLSSIYTKIEGGAEYVTDIDSILMSLETVYRNSMLEEEVQNPAEIARCFVRGAYYYNKSNSINVGWLNNFVKFLKLSSNDKKKIIINNLWQRIDTIKRYQDNTSNLPF